MLVVVDVVVEEESAGGCRKGPTSRDDMQFIAPFSCPSFAVTLRRPSFPARTL